MGLGQTDLCWKYTAGFAADAAGGGPVRLFSVVTSSPRQRLRRPRALLSAAAEPGGHGGFLVVTCCAAVALALNVATTEVGPPPLRTSGIALDITVALLTLAFWFGAAYLMDAAARGMGATSNRRACRATTAWAYPAVAALAALGLAEAGIAGAGAAAVASAIGWLAAPLLVVFVGVTVLGVATAYALPFLNALSVAMLPFAAMAALMLVLGLIAGIAGA